MKKKVLSAFLCTAMAVSMLVGCGGQGEQAAAPAETPADAAPADADAAAEVAEDAVAEAEAAAGERPEGGYKFGYTCMDGSNPFFVILEQTIREEVEANGDPKTCLCLFCLAIGCHHLYLPIRYLGGKVT